MPVFCPFCGTGLAEPIGRFCTSCQKDIGFMAPDLLNGAGTVSGEMTEAALFRQYYLQGKTEVVQNLKPGDLIEIFRDNFQHWAVYVGNGYVVELVVMEITSSGVSSAVSGGVAGAVRKIKLQDVVNRDKWQKNNAKHPRNDNTLKPRPEQEIVNEALSYVGKDINYTVATWNCEHFATWCRYGTGLSLQVKKTVKTASGLGVLGLLGSFVSGAMISNVPGSYSS